MITPNKGGRPKGPPTTQVSFRLTGTDLARADRIARHLAHTRGSGDRTAAVRWALERAAGELERHES